LWTSRSELQKAKMADDSSKKDPGAAPPDGVGEPPKPPAPPEVAIASDATSAKPVAPAAARPADVAGAKPAAPEKSAAPAAAKPAAPAAAVPAAAAAPKPAAPPKEAPPKPVPLDNEMVQRFKERFGEGLREAWLDRKQAILVVAADQLLDIAGYCRDEEHFDMLSDLTAVDWPKREKRFDLILNLYSFKKNERVRLKIHVSEGEPVASLIAVWPVANWLEREAYDMFGIIFTGHPNLQRILLPEEWQGYPLRKDYDILKQDTAWVRENLGIESGQ
jgi:NADH-quinone oxidoreductase subunit C